MAGEAPDLWILCVQGDWDRAPGPALASLEGQWDRAPERRRLSFDATALGAWNSLLVLFLGKVLEAARQRGLQADLNGLPDGARRLLRLSGAVPERHGVRKVATRAGALERLGLAILVSWQALHGLLTFTGELTLALGRLLLGRARFPLRDLGGFIQQCGADALPIVSLISVLIGLILAFVGAKQLAMFGAEVYVANLVGIGMTREMGAMMTAVIMAGRTGAAYSAQLGTMQVNEEIDAFRTSGFSPLDFLVLPRLLALVLMMPLLVLYADLLGILGGLLVAVPLFGVTITQYWLQIQVSVGVPDLLIGLFKGLVFGVLIASAGCYQGLECGRSSAAVGQATTRAVVMSIVTIVVADSLITLMMVMLRI